MDDFEEDVTRLSTHLDDLAEQISKDGDLASREVLKMLNVSITKLLVVRLDASMASIRESAH